MTQSAAPARVSKELHHGLRQDGKLTEQEEATDSRASRPSIFGRPDPMCFDAADRTMGRCDESKEANPTIQFPALPIWHGGYHWEKGGKIVMEEEACGKACEGTTSTG